MKKDPSHQLGKRLRALRRENDMTQEQLAAKAHISLKYVQSLEGKNPQNPSLEVLQKLADGFGVPLSKLLQFD